MNRLSREDMARRVAQDIPEGSYVNLGIGLPTLVADFLPAEREAILHSENGLLGVGPKPAPGKEDWELINAGKQPVTLRDGGCFFHHADSFAMMRASYIDISVLGAFQVAVNGDLANWHTGEADAIPSVGGAMDLAVGAKHSGDLLEELISGQKMLPELIERILPVFANNQNGVHGQGRPSAPQRASDCVIYGEADLARAFLG